VILVGSSASAGGGAILDPRRDAEGEGVRVRQNATRVPAIRAPRCCGGGSSAERAATSREKCLDELLDAFADIAERDDIHQAAERLARVQEWIRAEAEAAAADPIFAARRLAS
jgi:hypothetical protein